MPDVVEKIPWTSDFMIAHEKPRRVDVLDSSDGKDTSAACNRAFAKVVAAYQEKDRFNLKGEVGGLVKPEMVHVYDMEVAEDVVPKPHDDEVKEFYLMTPDETKKALFRQEFKTNSAAVMIDFFIRHGIITADNERDYPEMNMRLHRTLPFATAPRL